MTAPLRGLPVAEQTVPALLEPQAQRLGEREFVRDADGTRRADADADAVWAHGK